MLGGYAGWDIRMLSGGVFLNGEKLFDGSKMFPLSWPVEMPAARFRTVAGTHVEQRIAIGGDCPITLAEVSFSGQVNNDGQEDYQRLVELAWGGTLAGLMPHLWIWDIWHIPSANVAQTEWRTSRRLPYHLAGVTHVTHPPKAWIDDMEQEVLTSGTPGAGQVVVPASGLLAPIVTPADLSGTYLRLWYPPEFWVSVKAAWDNPEWNALGLQATFTDSIINNFTGYQGV